MTAIREESLRTAAKLGYQLNYSLPLLDEVESARSVSEVAGRVLCLYAVVACSYGFSKAKAKAWLAAEDLGGCLSPIERSYLGELSSRKQDASVQWRVEALWALAWSVGCHQQLDFSQHCGDDFVALFPDIAKDERANSFRARMNLREKSEIVAAADLAYCLHWAVRDAELRRATIPASLAADAIIQRRYALEWLIGTDNWDDVQMDT